MKTIAGRSWGPTSRVLVAMLSLIATAGCESGSKPTGDGDDSTGHVSRKGDGVESIIRGGERGKSDAGGHPGADGGEANSESGGDGGRGSELNHDDAGNIVDTSMPDGGTPLAAGNADAGETPAPAHELVLPDDPGAAGPWPVGVRTVLVALGSGKNMPVEVWYPAVPGSESSKDKVVYDLGDWLPPEAIAQMPASALPVPRECNCYRDLPLDKDHGPFPVSIWVHNLAGFRIASSAILAHWASRGFIALAADHPDSTLADWCDDTSRGRCTGSGIAGDTQHQRDIPAMLQGLRDPQGDLAFLAGGVDAGHVAISGHSEGAAYAAAASGEAGVRLIMIWNSSQTVTKRGDLSSVLYLASKQDGLLGTDPVSIEDTFWNEANTIAPAYFVNVNNAGHLSVTSFCNSKNAAGQTGMDLGTTYMLCGIDFTPLRLVWDCSASYLSQDKADLVFGYATSTALEAVLLGKDRDQAWAKFKSEWGEVKQVQ